MSSSNPFHHHPFQQIQEQQPQEQQQLLLQPFYHVPQQSRREKLRYQPPTSNPDHHSLFPSMLPSNTNNYLSLRGGPAPSEPFTGYVAVLKGSRFLGPAKEMLEEVCGGGGGGVDGGVCGELGVVVEDRSDHMHGHAGGVKSRLLAMLDEVYRKYKHYYLQIQYVITSFECVAGLSNASPYTSLALKSMFKHFQSLKNVIAEQLRFTDKPYGKECRPREDMRGYGSISGSLCYQGMPHNSGVIGQSNVWRPQRGLPERAVAVLKAWLFEHFLHPYPTDTDKHMLAKQTGLSRNQVSNWFINARVRLWKPMVEEIHSLEMRQAHNKATNADNNAVVNRQLTEMHAGSSEPSCSKQPVQNISSDQRDASVSHKRFRSEFNDLPGHIEEPVSLAFDDFPGHHQLANASSNSISLTLGLHQNNGLRIPEPVPLNVARRFGLDDTNTNYVMSGFEVQDRRQMDGQLLHDFVG